MQRVVVGASGDVIASDYKRRWALAIFSLGSLMVELDGTIVGVALPSIKNDLQFSESALVWVVNAYFLANASFLLIGGRLGDLFGHRRTFLFAIAAFTLASCGCGLAQSQGWLIGARALQGVCGAVVSALATTLAFRLFVAPAERATVLSFLAFVRSGSRSIALVLGGMVTSALNWHWIFFINIPVGCGVFALGLKSLPKDPDGNGGGQLDLAGAITVMGSVGLTLYAINNRSESGQTSPQTAVLLAAAAVFLITFFIIEAQVRAPLMPLSLLRLRNLAVANVSGAVLASALFTWSFVLTFNLQYVLKYSALQTGVAFLPATVVMAAFRVGLSARLIALFPLKRLVVTGFLVTAGGFLLFTAAPEDGGFLGSVLPAMLLVSVGISIASTPLLMAAMSQVAPEELGLASGVVGTVTILGGTIGLATLIGFAASRTNTLLSTGTAASAALASGHREAMFVCVALMISVALLNGAYLEGSFSKDCPREKSP